LIFPIHSAASTGSRGDVAIWVPERPAIAHCTVAGTRVVLEASPDVEVVVAPYEPPEHHRLREVLAAADRLRLVYSVTAGIDWLLPLVPPGVTICATREIHAGPVAEWVVAAVLGAARGLLLPAERHRGLRRFRGTRLTLLGYGSIGAEVERLLAPFEVEITRIARRPQPGVLGVGPGLARALPETDVLVVSVPLTEATKGLVDAPTLAALPDGALVVNASRGAVIVTDALTAELRAGRLRAILDVTDPEPLPPDHALRAAPGALITPHLAGQVDGTGYPESVYEAAGAEIARYLRGETLRSAVVDGY
jgi:phosphoglycerate dehydrogenase-like enzyme